MPTTGVETTESSVLSTINPDGSRKWIKPKPSRGRWWHARRIVAYCLIAAFALIPYLKLGGRPLVQLDITHRVFSLFGGVFYPTDTALLALLVVSIFVAIFLVTALSGRVWCGWACPQTVYMEFLFRPVERLFEGEPGRKTKVGTWRKPAKYLAYLALCAFLAHTFLAYFVGVSELRVWVTRSPVDHPVSFMVMAGVTAMMMFDFCFFREQTCLVACPYGRMQAVLLDRDSLIVSYDSNRGEPRGRKRRKTKTAPDISLKVVGHETPADDTVGDCIDCKKCVTTCPTGIDIRHGLQMECIHCTQCIDACDSVMEQIGRPRGLIRYSSQAAIEGGKRTLLRPRVIIYPLILAVLLGSLVSVLASKELAEVTVLRARGGLPYFPVPAPDGDMIGTRVKVHIRNRSAQTVEYSFHLAGVTGGSISRGEAPLLIEPFGLGTAEMVLLIPPIEYGLRGQYEVAIRVEGSDGFTKDTTYGLIGPAWIEQQPGD
jgi:cytochrome c oxidase accessory protein FixG